MRNASLPRTRARGYSVIEMLFAMGVIAAIGSLTLAGVGPSHEPSGSGDQAMRSVIAQLATARALSIKYGRPMEMQFIGPNQMRIVRRDSATAATVLSTVTIDGGLRFGALPKIPDTPDRYGNDHANGIAFGRAAAVMFNSDGRLVDETRRPRSGTVFFGIPNEAQSFRAVTVTGDTGRIRGYRWTRSGWR
jgi:Tfp pilus assembly protein FimT